MAGVIPPPGMPAPPQLPQLPAMPRMAGMKMIRFPVLIPGLPALPEIPALPGMEMIPPPPGIKVVDDKGKVIVAGPELPQMPGLPAMPGVPPAPPAPAEPPVTEMPAPAPVAPAEKLGVEEEELLEPSELEAEILAETEGGIEVPPSEEEIYGDELVLESDEIEALASPDEEEVEI